MPFLGYSESSELIHYHTIGNLRGGGWCHETNVLVVNRSTPGGKRDVFDVINVIFVLIGPPHESLFANHIATTNSEAGSFAIIPNPVSVEGRREY